ncbi:serine/threonine protein kinase [Chondromyces apiculatus]|uniref:Putative serine/threonine-protein kinase pknH n=1 Tax=Chondromyces apiculatus DSM 436 TaxID=1192034 RepID=A0A017SW75_9BACT|nr:serine/threonine-protein kinase [Chondromyces apiculatus]EYF01243.1 putative serine/threonine-protein kinase pknH [Chondromyces apiculatus DSM 436]
MAKEQNLHEGTVVAGRYRIERALGEGGMSTVYAVRHVHTGELLAMKLLRAAATNDLRSVELFRREMRAPAQIESEHVVRVTDADVAPELGNAPFLIMELLRGQDLEREVRERGAIPAPEVLLYLTQAARALDKAHKLGIIHRDLKPENLYLSRREDGTPWIKILDFGIAKIDPNVATEGTGGIGTTAAGEVFGTPLYMAPEQARGQNDEVGPWTDIWAVGVIAHKLLTGKDAWQPRSLAHLVSLVAYEPISTPSSRGVDLGGGFDEWFLRCCSRESDLRFATAGEAVTALSTALGVKAADPTALIREPPPALPEPSEDARREALGGSRELHPSSSPLSRTESEQPVRTGAWIAGALFAVMLGAGGLFLATRSGSARVTAPALPGVHLAASAAAQSGAEAAAAGAPRLTEEAPLLIRQPEVLSIGTAMPAASPASVTVDVPAENGQAVDGQSVSTKAPVRVTSEAPAAKVTPAGTAGVSTVAGSGNGAGGRRKPPRKKSDPRLDIRD